MRLVAWNANHNNRRRSFDANVALLNAFHADILVISETEKPTGASAEQVHYVGGAAPGLAVIARPGLRLHPHPLNAGAPNFMGAWEVCGDVPFRLLTAWPVCRPPGPSYHELLMDGLHTFGSFLERGPAVFAGDLNTSSRVTFQRTTHPLFVSRAQEVGLLSAYHEQTGEAHGEETVATYQHSGAGPTDFHIDYCFVSTSLISAASVSIHRSKLWLGRSDHCPIVLDIPDSAIRDAGRHSGPLNAEER